MADAAFFRKNWKLIALEENDVDKTEQNGRAYPVSNSMLIGNDLTKAGCLMIAWLDADGDLHVLRELKLDGGKLTGEDVVDPGSGNKCDITIEQNGVNLKGKIDMPSSESNLAGTWGAEAPPSPLTAPPVQAPRLLKAPVGKRLAAPGAPLRAGNPSLLLP
ncbi:MAG TPA: hypothetical protein VGS22_17855 [Thermoanaerobaculia bacterium]|jgi:hypothetical protein|nr:hypothetical protein [Thermoanaerobaculia bacterium]